MCCIEQFSHAKKYKTMKSTVKFNLDISNKSIITAEIQASNDVRDFIAQGFLNKLGKYGRLALCRKTSTTTDIEPFGIEKEECQGISRQLDIVQMQRLIEAFEEELLYRTKQTPDNQDN